MTNERAVEILNLDLDILGQYGGETAEAYKMAMKALEQEPSEDCISRAKALDTLKTSFLGMSFERYKKAKRMFEQLPSVTPRTNLAETSQDCISRQAVINTIFYKSDNSCDVVLSTDLMDRIKQLPSVTPQRPKGKWIEVLEHKDENSSTWHYECSECRARSYKGFEPLEKYCPNCGADMTESKEVNADDRNSN